MSKQIAERLLDAAAVVLRPQEPFTWASGWKSPIYCDNRVLLSYPEHRTAVTVALVELIQKEFPTVDCLAGVATAGIAWASLVAEKMNLPMIYVRPAAKAHGRGNQIEGRLQASQKLVVIEDLVSTGMSSLKVVDALRHEEDATVLGMVGLFQYGFAQAVKAFADSEIIFHSLTNYEELIKLASDRGAVPTEALKSLQNWRENPADWGK